MKVIDYNVVYMPLPTMTGAPTPLPVPVPNPTHPTICPTCGQTWPASLPVPINFYTVTAGNPNVRSGPGGSVLGVLTAGTILQMDIIQMGYGHFSIHPQFPNGGWVSTDYLTKLIIT